MRIDILTLFSQTFTGVFEESIIKRAREKEAISIHLHNLRDFGLGSRKTVDDTPFGGGAGMVLKVDVVHGALKYILKSQNPLFKPHVILLSSSGVKYNQKKAATLASLNHLVLVCGHYEGVDERVLNFCDEEISVGDFVLSGGEIPAMVIVDSVVRLIPHVLGSPNSLKEESFNESTREGKQVKLLEYPQYTRPPSYLGSKVPTVLISGNHEEIIKWRLSNAYEKTKRNRPDLLTDKF